MERTFPPDVTPHEAIDTIAASYKLRGYPTELPKELQHYVRSHLPRLAEEANDG